MENTKINQGGVYKNGCISPFEEKEQLTFIDFSLALVDSEEEWN